MIMARVSVPAHFDGKQILLDEPLDLKPNTKLIVTILPNNDHERESWLELSAETLQDAYSEDEEEYSTALIKELNPEYERE